MGHVLAQESILQGPVMNHVFQVVALGEIVVVMNLVIITGSAGVLHQLLGSGILDQGWHIHSLSDIIPVDLLLHLQCLSNEFRWMPGSPLLGPVGWCR